MEYYQNQNLELLTCYFEGEFFIEEWKPIKGYELRYEVSTFGRIRSIKMHWNGKGGGIKKLRLNRTGYPVTHFGQKRKGDVQHFRIHFLVGSTFIKNLLNKPFINHRDGIKVNNFYKNLEWVTAKENVKHAYENNLIPILRGVDRPQSILTEKQVIEIFNAPGTNTEIAALFNTHRANIGFIKSGRSWSHVTGKIYKRKRLEKKEVILIRKQYKEGLTIKQIASKWNRKVINIKNIINNFHWENI